MIEKRIAEWKQKNDVLESERYQVKKKLEYAMRRQENLKYDILVPIVMLGIVLCVLIFLFSYQQNIMPGFSEVYGLTVRAALVFSLIYFPLRIIRAARRWFYHNMSVPEWAVPRPRRSNSDVGVPPEKNYQSEIEKLCWIEKQYEKSRRSMDDMYRRLQEGNAEIGEQEWQEFIDSIIIYETVKPARL